jgi:hypothetical protein
MKAWQPLLTPGPVIISFFVIGIVFIPIGAVLFTFSNAVSIIIILRLFIYLDNYAVRWNEK